MSTRVEYYDIFLHVVRYLSLHVVGGGVPRPEPAVQRNVSVRDDCSGRARRCSSRSSENCSGKLRWLKLLPAKTTMETFFGNPTGRELLLLLLVAGGAAVPSSTDSQSILGSPHRGDAAD